MQHRLAKAPRALVLEDWFPQRCTAIISGLEMFVVDSWRTEAQVLQKRTNEASFVAGVQPLAPFNDDSVISIDLQMSFVYH